MTVKVVQLIVPILLNVPDVYVDMLEQVKLNVAKLIVPAVIVKVVQFNAAANVVVPAPLLITNGPNVVLVFGVIVPVPRIVAVKLVNTPAPLDKVKLFKFKFVVERVNAVVPKLSVLNQLPVVSVATDEPLLNVKFGALVEEPPVVPNINVLVTDIILVNPPVPVYVKLVASVISNIMFSPTV